jgi:transposase
MIKKRKKYSSEFKFKLALEAVKGQATINEIASSNNIHPYPLKTSSVFFPL